MWTSARLDAALEPGSTRHAPLIDSRLRVLGNRGLSRGRLDG
jgi:hypothetical protein